MNTKRLVFFVGLGALLLGTAGWSGDHGNGHGYEPPKPSKTKPDGACFDNENRYVDCGNGTVTDTVTGLIWLKKADCFAPMNWADANRAAAALRHGYCGLKDGSSAGDWRLPTRAEWNATTAKSIELGCALNSGCSSTANGSSNCLALTDTTGTTCFYSPGAKQPFTGTPQQGGTNPMPLYWTSTSNDLTNIWGPSGPSLAYFEVLFTGGDPYFEKANISPRVWPVRVWHEPDSDVN